MAKTTQNALVPFRQALSAAAGHLEMALPATSRKYLTADRMTKIMLSAISRNPTLATCTVESILQVCMAGAQLGLEPAGPLGHLYAVPYRNRKTGKMEAVPIIGYRGFVELARRSGKVHSIEAHVVYSNDEFTLEYGMNPKLEHKPKLIGDRGEVVAVYCIARMEGGATQVDVMTRSEVDAIRARSRAADSGPWKSDYAEMAKKTVVRRAAKYWPLSTEMAQAIEIESQVESGAPVSVAVADILPEGEIVDGGDLPEEDEDAATQTEKVARRIQKASKKNGKSQKTEERTENDAPEQGKLSGVDDAEF